MKWDDFRRSMATRNQLIQPPVLKDFEGKNYRLLNQLHGLLTTVNILSK